LEEKVAAPLQKTGRRGSAELIARHPYIRTKFTLTSPTSGGRSVGIVRSRTQFLSTGAYSISRNEAIENSP
jgi:hypothetical protein